MTCPTVDVRLHDSFLRDKLHEAILNKRVSGYQISKDS